MARKKIIDKEKLNLEILSYLRRYGKTPVSTLCGIYQLSQPSLSRILQNVRDEIVVIGKAKKTVYAARRKIDAHFSFIPIYEIEKNGKSNLFGNLHALEPIGFYCQCENENDEKSFFSSDLPYFLNDLRPSGFVGNLIPSQNPDLHLPRDVRSWSADHCLKYLCLRSWDHIGNFILGDEAFNLYLENVQTPQNTIDVKSRMTEYSHISDNVLAAYDPGSSAGGDQPKFLTILMPKQQHVIVKFSPKTNSDIGKRIADLLICEYLAAKTLKASRQDAVDCEVIFNNDRTFLEIKRFDRLKGYGRRGVISLGTLDAEFGGTLGTWSETAQVLVQEKILTREMLQQIRWRELFSELIGNNDMHLYNVSFYTEGTHVVGLTPIYDMLPMIFMPRSNQIIQRKFNPPLPHPSDSKIWDDVFAAAELFWNEVIKHEMITNSFKKISKECLEQIKKLKNVGRFLPKG
jgi:hypothetical protein